METEARNVSYICVVNQFEVEARRLNKFILAN